MKSEFIIATDEFNRVQREYYNTDQLQLFDSLQRLTEVRPALLDPFSVSHMISLVAFRFCCCSSVCALAQRLLCSFRPLGPDPPAWPIYYAVFPSRARSPARHNEMPRRHRSQGTGRGRGTWGVGAAWVRSHGAEDVGPHTFLLPPRPRTPSCLLSGARRASPSPAIAQLRIR